MPDEPEMTSGLKLSPNSIKIADKETRLSLRSVNEKVVKTTESDEGTKETSMKDP